MGYDLNPLAQDVEPEIVNILSWPPIWDWLCATYNDLYLPEIPDSIIRAGFYNDGQHVSADIAKRFADILKSTPKDHWAASYLDVQGRSLSGRAGTRRDRLIAFFNECGGFQIC